MKIPLHELHLPDQILPPHRFIEEPHGSKETDELTAGAEVVQRHVLDGKRRLRVRRRSGSGR